MPALLSVKEISAQQTYQLRRSILRPHQTVAQCVFPGDENAKTFHFGGFLDGVLVVIASVMKEPEERFKMFACEHQLRLRAMATVAKFRGNGFGSAVLDACVDRSWAEGGEVLWCNARTSAAEFYRKGGFLTLPETFEIPSIGPHQVMYLHHAKSSGMHV